PSSSFVSGDRQLWPKRRWCLRATSAGLPWACDCGWARSSKAVERDSSFERSAAAARC
ncbi:Hypothetical protein SCLAV_1272, partial [Streptomyces clavuligerus]